MSLSKWKTHAGKWLISAAFILLTGFLIGHPLATVAVSLFGYAIWHTINVWRLHQWQTAGDDEVPKSHGIWSAIYEHIEKEQQENREKLEANAATIGALQELNNAFPDASLVIDSRNRMTWFNQSCEHLLGLKNPTDTGQVVTHFLRGSDFADWLAASGEVNKPLQIQSPTNDNVWLEISSVSLFQDQKLLILRDITQIHYSDQIRRDFVANISHELRTPLTVIKGYLELLQSHSSKDVSGSVIRMQSQTEQIQLLLDDLLELSRLQNDEIQNEEESVDIPALLNRLQIQAREISRGQHELVFNADNSLHLAGTSSDLESAFGNLISNAVKYTPAGGTITVDWHDSPAGPQLVVSDSGIGIPHRDIPRITERFYRVGSDRARQTGGSGLGLSIVKHVLNAHHAKLSIESDLGAGSTFTCSFPNERRRDKAEPVSATSKTPDPDTN